MRKLQQQDVNLTQLPQTKCPHGSNTCVNKLCRQMKQFNFDLSSMFSFVSSCIPKIKVTYYIYVFENTKCLQYHTEVIQVVGFYTGPNDIKDKFN